jgi:hopanoid C-2 methylase
VVNCYFDDLRQDIPRTRKIPMAMAPVFLAGAFDRERCDVRLYNEVSSGALQNRDLLAWPDVLVLTGLTTAFDRMLHLTAYARTLNNKVVVVAGGPAIRAFPKYARQFFDYVCWGDVEELSDVAVDLFGADALAGEMNPRFDLAYWIRDVGHVESSRNCNFRCSFCSLTADGNGYRKYSIDYLRKQILAVGYKRFLLFLDNNFYGNDQHFFQQRIDLLEELHRENRFGGWAALVSNDFFYNDKNLERARRSGCVALFSGVESFDSAWLRSMNKRQNNRLRPVELISKCLNAGIVFLYGMMLDVTTRTVADLENELEFIFENPDITLPSYLSMPIPFPGTPFFNDCARQNRLLPNTRVRDLNSAVLSLKPLESIERVRPFIARTQTMHSYRSKILKHTWSFYRRYRRVLPASQLRLCVSNSAWLFANEMFTAPAWMGRRRERTYISSSERLDDLYRPSLPVASRYRHYFSPTMLTDAGGEIAPALRDDLCRDSEAQTPTEPLAVLASA